MELVDGFEWKEEEMNVVSYVLDRVVLIAMAVLLIYVVLADRKDFRESMNVAKEYIISLQESNDALNRENEIWRKKYWKEGHGTPEKKGGK